MIDRMPPVQTKRRRPTSKPATPDPFAMLAETMPPRDQRSPQGRPFLSLSKAKRRTPVRKYPAASRRISQSRYCNHSTRDVLIPASAKSSPTSVDCRTFRFIAIGRATDHCECKSLKGALARLTSAVMRVTIRQLKLANTPTSPSREATSPGLVVSLGTTPAVSKKGRGLLAEVSTARAQAAADGGQNTFGVPTKPTT
jgi:hypothetical protein